MKKLLPVVALLFTANCFSQPIDKRTWSWYFGSMAGLSFSSTSQPPVPVTTSMMSAYEGSSSISDTAGNILFYTDGMSAWASDNTVLPNGTNLKGSSISAQSALLVPKPGSNSLFYLFTVNNWTDPATELNYSVIDKTLNGGLGDVVAAQKNILVNASCREMLTAVFHSNGQDIWILSHETGNNYFVAYLLTAQGLSATPVISPTGALVTGWNRYGYLKVSPNCNKIAYALGGPGPNAADTTVQVCDFNNQSGVVSNAVFLADYLNVANAYGCDFSPNSSKLYVTEFNASVLYQFDLNAANPSASRTNISNNNNNKASLALGPDGKIYVSKNIFTSLGVIDFPDMAGIAAGYNDNGVLLSAGTGTIGSCNLFHRCSTPTPVFSMNKGNYLKVFPNPASNKLTIEFPSTTNRDRLTQIKITDVTGRIIFEREEETGNNTHKLQIDVNTFSKGIYFLCVRMGADVFSEKVMLE